MPVGGARTLDAGRDPPSAPSSSNCRNRRRPTFQAAQAKLQAELRGQLVPILADIAKRYGTDFVLNSDTAVAWAAPGTDATDEVLRRLNAPPQ